MRTTPVKNVDGTGSAAPDSPRHPFFPGIPPSETYFLTGSADSSTIEGNPNQELRVILGVGIDIVDLAEFRGRLTDDLIAELFLPDEIEYCRSQKRSWENFAGRFAAKEAAFKALGAGLADGLRFLQVEVVRAGSGAVRLELTGRAAELAAERGVLKTHVSLSHSRTVAAAVVVAEGEST